MHINSVARSTDKSVFHGYFRPFLDSEVEVYYICIIILNNLILTHLTSLYGFWGLITWQHRVCAGLSAVYDHISKEAVNHLLRGLVIFTVHALVDLVQSGQSCWMGSKGSRTGTKVCQLTEHSTAKVKMILA